MGPQVEGLSGPQAVGSPGETAEGLMGPRARGECPQWAPPGCQAEAPQGAPLARSLLGSMISTEFRGPGLITGICLGQLPTKGPYTEPAT